VTSPFPVVEIHYLRPPGRKEIFRQRLLLDNPSVKVSLAQNVPFEPPILIHGEVALEAGSDAVWFTFPGRWHDIGRFHRKDGAFTGIYANILTPPRILPGGIWQTTDLFLDVWIDPGGTLSVLDEDHLVQALEASWISPEEGERAREEVAWIRNAHSEGTWPPPIVSEWTLERSRRALRGSQASEEAG